jgi:hypothetical protein
MLPSELRVVAFVLASLRRVPFPEENPVQVGYHLGYLDALQRVADALSVPARPQTQHRPGIDPAGPHAA